MTRLRLIGLLAAFALPCPASAARPPDLRLPAILGDGAVVQRGVPVSVWGWAAPGARVDARLADQLKTATTAPDGKWQLAFDPVEAGSLGDMTVRAGKQAITVKDLLAGEVWVCSGQSNMQMSLAASLGAEEELQRAGDAQLRLFKIPRIASGSPVQDLKARWQQSGPSSAAPFSAVGYYFGRELRRRLKVPVGLIMAAWGGTTAEVWTDPASLAADGDLSPILRRWNERLTRNPDVLRDNLPFSFEIDAMELVRSDASRLALTGREAKTSRWGPPAFGDSSRAAIRSGSRSVFSGTLGIAGSASVLRDLELSGRPVDVSGYATLRLRARGQGAFFLQLRQPSVVDGAWHALPAFFARPEWTEYTLRLADFRQPSWGEQKPLTLDQVSGVAICIEAAMPVPEQPSSLFNSMLRPVLPHGIRGALWYQGEGNAGRAFQYRRLLTALIGGWRRAWGQGDFPFYIVQLPGYGPVGENAEESEWAEMREAQAAALGLANTGLVCTVDLGEPGNVHPRNKSEVGIRLSQIALARTYGIDVEYSGPRFLSAAVEGNRMRVQFADIGTGVKSRDGGPLRGFSVAGEDRIFHKAIATIDGDTVVVESPEVRDPIAVRYAWAASPVCNLAGANGLPAWPFRSDTWPGKTTTSK